MEANEAAAKAVVPVAPEPPLPEIETDGAEV
jgi:hypothetical protein